MAKRLKWRAGDDRLIHQFEVHMKEYLRRMKEDPQFFFDELNRVEGHRIPLGGLEYWEITNHLLKKVSKGSFKLTIK